MSFFDEDDTQEQEEESFFSLRTPVPGPSSPSVRVADPDPDGRGISVEPSEESNRPEDSAALLEETERRRKQQLETEGNVVQRLSRRWIDERHAPELLVHDAHGEMDECLQMLLRQVGP